MHMAKEFVTIFGDMKKIRNRALIVRMARLTWSKKYRWNQKSLTWNGQTPSGVIKIMNHVSHNYAEFKDSPLLTRSEAVHVSLVANAAQATGCPVSAADLDTANKDFSAKINALAQGGPAATLARDAARQTVLGLLSQIAAWLEGKAQGNVDIIVLFHFDYTSPGHHPAIAPGKPVIKAILNEATTQLKVRVNPEPHAHSYLVQYRINSGAWVTAGSFTDSRGMLIPGLTPGTLYEFRVQALGGKNVCSDWSDLVTHMCM